MRNLSGKIRLAVFLAITLTMFVQPVGAECTARVTADLVDANNQLLTYTYYGSGPQSCGGTSVYSSWDGGNWMFVDGGQNRAVVDVSQTIGVNCLSVGTHTIDIRVDCSKIGPSGICVSDSSKYAHAEYEIEHAVGIPRAAARRHDSSIEIKTQLSWLDSWHVDVTLSAYAEMARSVSSVLRNGAVPDLSGAANLSIGVDPLRPYTKLVAHACDKWAFRIVSAADNDCGCPDCGDCTGGPIRLSNGNMRYTDSDPLPASGMTSLTRTYDSTNAENGWFGHGWTSFLDEWLRTETEVNGSTTVAIGTAGGDRYFFNGGSGAFRQLWPVGPAHAVLGTDANGYVLRPYGSNLEHHFDANGRIYKLRQVTNGRETIITYDGAGLITRVEDSWGNWAWNVTADSSTQRITTIAVEGTPISWTYLYSSSNLTTVRESGVTSRTYTYNGALTEIHDAAGHLIESHAYGAAGATSSIGQTDDITSITYDIATGDPNTTITRVTSATGAQTDYYVTGIAGRLRTGRVEGGCPSCTARNAIYGYDDEGRQLRAQDARGYITERTYDGLNRVTAETVALKPAGCDPETAFDHCRLTLGLGTAALEPTSASVTKTFSYDTTWPDHVAAIETASSLTEEGWPLTRLETMAYHATSGEVVMHQISGWTNIPFGDGLHQDRTTFTTLYDGTEGAAFAPGGAFESSWQNLPQPAHMRKSTDGPRTDLDDLATLVYYPVHSSVPALLRGHLAAIRNAAGHITRYENYDAFGNAQRVIDPNGVVNELSFDHLGRSLTKTTKAVSGCDTAADPLCATDLVTSRAYTPATGPLTLNTDAIGNVTSYEYDLRGRVATVSRGPSASDLRERIAYTYDSATGRKSMEQYLGRESGAWVEKRRESFAYDALAQLITQTHADSTSVGYTYDVAGGVASVRDENHTSAPNTTYKYDPLRRLSSVTQTLSSAAGGAITTSYSYDNSGNLIAVTDPNGNTTSYVYDDFGAMVSQNSPVTGFTQYEYDFAGNLTSSVGPDEGSWTFGAEAATTTRTYDEANRPLNSVSSRNAGSEEVTWTYDAATAGAFGIGRLATMTSPDSTTTYVYNRRGLLRQENLSIWDEPFVQTYGYDANGNRTSIGYPSGRVVTYTLDFAGRPITASGLIDSTTTNYVTAASYQPFGSPASLSFGNGAVETRTYDQRYHPSGVQLTAAGSTLASYAYASDPVGNITQITDSTNAGYSRTFAYDDVSRLVTANSGGSLWGSGGYTYDGMGNMLTASLGGRTRSFTYSGTTPMVSTATDNGTVTSMAYDALGNELNGPAGPTPYSDDTRTYSPRNLLQQIDLASRVCLGPQQGETCTYWGRNVTTIWNGYDGRGVRVGMTQTTSLSPHEPRSAYFFYTPELTPLNAVSPSDSTQSDVIWFAGKPVAQEHIDGPLTRFTFTDHLGTPILQMDPAAAVVWRAEYEPFGDVYAMRAGTRNDQPLRFPGQQVAFTNNASDEESYNIFRWYSAGWGRYTQADPIGLLGGINEYGYVDDRPLSLIDPTGLQYTHVPTPEEFEERKQRSCARDAFLRNYQDMRKANWKLSDKYFHCKANCEASRCGKYGEDEACDLGNFREWSDQLFGESAADAAADQAANRFGRAQAKKNPNKSCGTVCSSLRPKGLPSQY